MSKFILAGLGLIVSLQSFAQTPWTDRFSFKGDFRLRGESIDDEVASTGESYERNRMRMRARLQINAKVNDKTDAIFRFASGGLTEQDTTSTNQDLTDYGAKKGLNLDMAYANWKPNESAQVWLGKSPYVYFQPGSSDLVFDTDVTTEGISYKDAWKGEALTVFWNAGYWMVDELNTAGRNTPDVTAVGGDLGITYKVSDATSLTLGGGFINFANIEDAPVTATAIRGNTALGTAPNQTYAYKYELARGYFEASTNLLGLATTLYYDYVQNHGRTDHNKGSLVGIRFGKLKNIGDWTLSADYRDVDADATLGVLAESDTGGGGTNIINQRYVVGYQLAEGTNATLAYSQAIRRANASGVGTDYQRVMLDLVYSF